jgi:copper homeostasis protein (lipoprotein)
MRSTVLCPLFGVLLSTGLGCTSTSTGDPATTDAGPPVVEAPATYAGTLPCASCPGIEWTLTVLEDGTYRLRRVYLDAEVGENRPLVELGRWDTGGSDDRLVLRGRSDGPIRFEVQDAETLRLLSQQGQPIESELDYGLTRLADVDRIANVFAMRGEFSYMADAGRFSECHTRKSLPVAQEVDNAALERAYLEISEEPGGPVLVTFDGRFAMRPPMEGDGLHEVVIVEAFGEARSGERCEGAVDPAPLAGTYWRLTELPDEEGFTVDPGLRAHLVLDGEEGRVSGSSGCNRLVGTFVLNGDALSFGPLAGTRMACPPPAMALERKFHAALASVARYSIDGEALTLLEGPDGAVAIFERYLE